MTGDRPEFTVAVCGSDAAPAWFVRGRLDAATRAKRRTHELSILVGGEESPARAWAESATLAGVAVDVVELPLLGSSAKDPDWAKEVTDVADAVVIFGDPSPWWLVHSFAFGRGKPVRHLALPRPSPLTGAGPGGYPD